MLHSYRSSPHSVPSVPVPLGCFRACHHVMGCFRVCKNFNIITWYGNVSEQNKVKLARVVNTASKLIGNNQKQLSSIYKDALKRKSTQILYDPAHPLNQAFQKLPSGRRLKVPLAKKKSLQKIVCTLCYFNFKC